MDAISALVLGTLQGLTEYLPVSSSGHLVVGSAIMGATDSQENLSFAVVVHAATSLASLIIFRQSILEILKDLIQFKWNTGTRYVAMMALATIPVLIVGLFLKDELEAIFGNIQMVGYLWILTGVLLLVTQMVKSAEKELTFTNTFIIGIAQAIAVLPGISRSGATISTALLQGVKREEAAKFSFLMVIVPIFGEALLDVKKIMEGEGAAASHQLGLVPATVGFIAAFVVGLLACVAMLKIVQRGKLHYFSIYCFVIGILAVLISTGIINF